MHRVEGGFTPLVRIASSSTAESSSFQALPPGVRCIVLGLLRCDLPRHSACVFRPVACLPSDFRAHHRPLPAEVPSMIDPTASYYVPTVVEQTHRGERAYDIFRVFFSTESSSSARRSTIRWPMPSSPSCCSWKARTPKKTSTCTSTALAASVTAGLAIYDTMQYIRPDVATICMGQAASMGAFLLAAGAKGKRRSLPHGRVMIHQPSAGGALPGTDIEIWATEIPAHEGHAQRAPGRTPDRRSTSSRPTSSATTS